MTEINWYDTVIVLDWNSGNDTGPKPRKDAIWAAIAHREWSAEPVYLRNRDVALDWLNRTVDAELRKGCKVMIGVDFPLGYPEPFTQAIVGIGSPLRLWDFFADALDDTPNGNNRFDLAGELNGRFPGVGPFWFNALKRDILHLPRTAKERTRDHGQKERRVVERRHKGTFTVWQMGGAGSVGGQVMTGMAALSKFRQRFAGKVSVWPFDTWPAPIQIVEVWPTLIDPAVKAADDPIRDRAQVRLLARALAALPRDTFLKMLSVDAPEEGWILGTGFEQDLMEHTWPT